VRAYVPQIKDAALACPISAPAAPQTHTVPLTPIFPPFRHTSLLSYHSNSVMSQFCHNQTTSSHTHIHVKIQRGCYIPHSPGRGVHKVSFTAFLSITHSSLSLYLSLFFLSLKSHKSINMYLYPSSLSSTNQPYIPQPFLLNLHLLISTS